MFVLDGVIACNLLFRVGLEGGAVESCSQEERSLCCIVWTFFVLYQRNKDKNKSRNLIWKT